MTWLFSIFLKLATSGTVDRVLGYMEQRAALGNERERFESKVRIETIRAAVTETRIMADLQKSKFQHWIYWAFVAAFLAPLAIWWTAVLADSLFLFAWNVAALPAPLDQWAGEMIRFLFYTGTVVGALKILK